jgi:hypothetical protein
MMHIMTSPTPDGRQHPDFAGYLYVHFKAESVDGEQIHFALTPR